MSDIGNLLDRLNSQIPYLEFGPDSAQDYEVLRRLRAAADDEQRLAKADLGSAQQTPTPPPQANAQRPSIDLARYAAKPSSPTLSTLFARTTRD